jgi:hypothetical protein
MIEWNRDGHGQGGALLHVIGSPDDINELLNNGPIDWLTAQIYSMDPSGNPVSTPVINDCMDHNSDNPPSCSAHALLRSDLLPIGFNYPLKNPPGSSDPYNVGWMHPIGLVYDPFALTENSRIADMYVLDGDTVNIASAQHPECTVERGWDWYSNYNGQGDSYQPDCSYQPYCPIFQAMDKQCRFGLESEDNWAGFWGNFIDARKNFLMMTRSGDTTTLPDDSTYLEPEVDVWIRDASAWEDMYHNALKAVLVQTNYCNEQLTDAVANVRCKHSDEDSVIRYAKLAACRVALQIKQDTGNDIPVIEASLLSSSMVVPDTWDKYWSGDHYNAPASDYMQYYDCCWLLNEEGLYDQLAAVGWYDNQCCYEQNGGYWKNCDYCENCG